MWIIPTKESGIKKKVTALPCAGKGGLQFEEGK